MPLRQALARSRVDPGEERVTPDEQVGAGRTNGFVGLDMSAAQLADDTLSVTIITYVSRDQGVTWDMWRQSTFVGGGVQKPGATLPPGHGFTVEPGWLTRTRIVPSQRVNIGVLRDVAD